MNKVLSFIVGVMCLWATCVGAQVGISSPFDRAANLYYVDASEYGTLNDAVTVVAVTGGTVVVNSATTITSSLTVPDNVSIEVKCPNGSITVPTGYRLNIEGNFKADKCRAFVCVGDEVCVTFGTATNNVTSTTALATRPAGKVNEVWPEWWGAVYGSQVAADMTKTTRAINAAVRSLNEAVAVPVSGGVYNFKSGRGGVVRISGPMEVNGTVKLTPAVDLVCDNPGSVFYYPYETNSYIRCNQVDGTDCVTATMDKTLFEGDSTYQVCQLKGDYNLNQVYNTMPFRVRIENCGIFGLDNRTNTQGYGVVLGDPPTWVEDLKTSSLSINDYHEGFCGGNWAPTYGAYDSLIQNTVVSRHGKSGIHMGQAASSKIWANHVHGNARNGIDLVSYTNGMSITGNHIQGNCVAPYKWYNTGLSSIAYETPVTTWTASNATLTAGLGGVDGSYILMALTGANGYMYRDINVAANTDYIFTVFFRRNNGSSTDADEDSAVKVQVLGNTSGTTLHSSISLVGSPGSTATGVYYTRYLAKFNTGTNTSIRLKLAGTDNGKHSYWDGAELYRFPYNLTTNGTFDSGVAGWTDSGAASAAVGGKLELTDSGGAGGYTYQEVDTVSGAKYVLSFKYYRHATNPSNGKAIIGTAISPTAIYDGPIKTAQDTSEVVPFQATGAKTLIGLVSVEAGKVSVWDDVTVTRIDTCVNGIVSSAALAGSKIENNTIESGGSDSGNLWAYLGAWIYAARGSSYDSNYHEANAPGALPMRWLYTAYNRSLTIENNGFYLNARTDQTPSCTAVYAEATFHTNIISNMLFDTTGSATTGLSPACTMATFYNYAYYPMMIGNTRYWVDPVSKVYVTDSDVDDLYTGTTIGSFIYASDKTSVRDLEVRRDAYVEEVLSGANFAIKTLKVGDFVGGVDDVGYINFGDIGFNGQVNISLYPSYVTGDSMGNVEAQCSFHHTIGTGSFVPPMTTLCSITKADGYLANRYGIGQPEINTVTVDASTGDITFAADTKTISRSAGLSVLDVDFVSLTVAGSSDNDGTYTIVSVSDTEIVVEEALIDEVSSAATLTQNNMRVPVYHMHPDGTEQQAIYARIEARSMFTTPGFDNNAIKLTDAVTATAPAVPGSPHGLTRNWVHSLNYGGVRGEDSRDAELRLYADEGDDAGDKWSIVSQASGNDLSFQNNSVEKMNLDTSGNLTVTGGFPDAYLPVMTHDEYSARKHVFVSNFTAGASDVAYINFGDTTFNGQIDLRMYPSFLNTAAPGVVQMMCAITHTQGDSTFSPTGTPTPGCSITRAEGSLATWYGFAPMEVDAITVSAAAGTVTYVAATKKITRASGLSVLKSAFGKIKVTGTASNDGSYTIVTISDTEIVVAETLVDETDNAGQIAQYNLRVPLYHITVVPSEYQSLIVEMEARSMYTTPAYVNHADTLLNMVTVTAPAIPGVPHTWTAPISEFWGLRVKGIEASDARLQLWADEGDDAGDKWELNSGATNRFALKFGADGAQEERFGCDINGVCRVTAGEGLDASIEVYADQGDDAGDKWSMVSQVDNDLSFQNNGVEKCKITTAGTMACTAFTGDGSGLTGIGVSISDTAYGASWDTVTTIGPSKNAVYDKVETLAPKDSPTFTTYVINRMGTTGGYKMMAAEATATLSGASTTIQTNVPADSRVLGVQLRVDTAVTSGDGATSWTATYSGGLTSSITTSRPFAQNTKFNSLVGGDAASEVDIDITPDAHTFSGGVIRAIVYYETFVAMDSL